MSVRVMLVDDSEPDLIFTQLMLERCGCGFEVLPVDSAMAALEHLKQADHGIELILLDINMPVMNGFEFLDHYQHLPGADKPVVVMLSSSPLQLDRERALAYPCVRSYVTKPIDLAQAATLARWIDPDSDATTE